jgi:hypothetical protein
MLNIKNITVLIILILCLVSSVGAQYSTFEYSEEEAQLYRMPIKQVTPKDGIWTGYVIAYGHYIKRPYRFEIREGTLLFINSVKVYPPLTSGISLFRKAKLREKYRDAESLSKPYTDRFEYLVAIAKSAYSTVASEKGRNTAIDSIYNFFKNDTLLRKILVNISIEPTGKNDATMSIRLRYPGYGGPANVPTLIAVPFYLDPPEPAIKYESKEEEIAIMRQCLDDRVKNYCEALKNNKVLLFSSFRRLPHISKIDVLVNIVEIMHTSQPLTEQHKGLRRLRLADEKEILYNFNPGEWPSLENLNNYEEEK